MPAGRPEADPDLRDLCLSKLLEEARSSKKRIKNTHKKALTKASDWRNSPKLNGRQKRQKGENNLLLTSRVMKLGCFFAILNKNKAFSTVYSAARHIQIDVDHLLLGREKLRGKVRSKGHSKMRTTGDTVDGLKQMLRNTDVEIMFTKNIAKPCLDGLGA